MTVGGLEQILAGIQDKTVEILIEGEHPHYPSTLFYGEMDQSTIDGVEKFFLVLTPGVCVNISFDL